MTKRYRSGIKCARDAGEFLNFRVRREGSFIERRIIEIPIDRLIV